MPHMFRIALNNNAHVNNLVIVLGRETWTRARAPHIIPRKS